MRGRWGWDSGRWLGSNPGHLCVVLSLQVLCQIQTIWMETSGWVKPAWRFSVVLLCWTLLHQQLSLSDLWRLRTVTAEVTEGVTETCSWGFLSILSDKWVSPVLDNEDGASCFSSIRQLQVNIKVNETDSWEEIWKQQICDARKALKTEQDFNRQQNERWKTSDAHWTNSQSKPKY